jgi:ABC-type glycerol-3-phosphate transport system permease component
MDCSNRRTRHMKKKLTEDKIVDIVVYFLLAIIGIITVYPFYYTIICSLNDGMDLMKGGGKKIRVSPRDGLKKSF